MTLLQRPRGRGRRCRTHPGQPQRGRLSGRVGRRAGLFIPAAAAVRMIRKGRSPVSSIWRPPGCVDLFLLRHVVSGRQLVTAFMRVAAAALGLIATLLVHSHDIETTGRQQLLRRPIIAYRQERLPAGNHHPPCDDLRLYLDGGLQF